MGAQIWLIMEIYFVTFFERGEYDLLATSIDPSPSYWFKPSEKQGQKVGLDFG